jgi:hypothetical protein
VYSLATLSLGETNKTSSKIKTFPNHNHSRRLFVRYSPWSVPHASIHARILLHLVSTIVESNCIVLLRSLCETNKTSSKIKTCPDHNHSRRLFVRYSFWSVPHASIHACLLLHILSTIVESNNIPGPQPLKDDYLSVEIT